MRANKLLSLVVPAYNEGEMVHLFLDRVLPILADTGMRFEVILWTM